MDEIQPLTYPTQRTFEILADSKVIENDFFLIKDKRLVCFADRSGNKEFENYIKINIESIKIKLSQKGWNFVHRPSKIDNVELFSLSYYFPFTGWNEHINKELQNIPVSETSGNQILDFHKYEGPAKTGFISIARNKFVFIAKKDDEHMEDFVQQFLAFMPIWLPRVYGAFPPGFDTEKDKETAETIYTIKANLDRLKENGQFFAIAPVLLKMIEEAFQFSPDCIRELKTGIYLYWEI